MKQTITAIFLIILFSFLLAACASGQILNPTITPAPTLTSTPTNIITKTATFTLTPTLSPFPTLTITPLPTITPKTSYQVITTDNVSNLHAVDSISIKVNEIIRIYWSSDNSRLLLWSCLASTGSSCGNFGNALLIIDTQVFKTINTITIYPDPNTNSGRVFSGDGHLFYNVESVDMVNLESFFIDADTGRKKGQPYGLNPSIPGERVLGLDNTGDIYIGNVGYGLFLAKTSSDEVTGSLETPDGYWFMDPGVFSNDGKKYAQVIQNKNGVDDQVYIWDLDTGKSTTHFTLIQRPNGWEHIVFPSLITFSADGSRLLGYVQNRGVEQAFIWDLVHLKKIRSIEWATSQASRANVALSPDGLLLAGIVENIVQNRPQPVLQIWNIENGEIVAEIPINGSDISGLSFSGDGRTIVVGLNNFGNNNDSPQLLFFAANQ